MMPGGSKDGYDAIRHIVEKVAAQVDDGPCVTYIGPGGAGEPAYLPHIYEWPSGAAACERPFHIECLIRQL